MTNTMKNKSQLAKLLATENIEVQENKVQTALKPKLHVPFRFDNTGSKIIYYSHQK